MPLTQELRITFTEAVPRRRLAYVHLADLIPGSTHADSPAGCRGLSLSIEARIVLIDVRDRTPGPVRP